LVVLAGANKLARIFETLTCRSRPAIKLADEAAGWTHWNLLRKNTLAAADAKIIEERFQARLNHPGISSLLSGDTRGRSYRPGEASS
jgi:hypothetical protein